jgi:hypothetical protein
MVAATAARHVEPRRPILRRLSGLALEAQHHGPARVAHPQPGERVDDHAQPGISLEPVVPAIGLVAVHALEERAVIGCAQPLLDFGCQGARTRNGPLGQQPCVDEGDPALHVHERPCAQPREQLVAVGRRQDVVDGVTLAPPLHALGHAQEVQVVVAEHGDRGVSQPLHETQAGERVGPRLTRSPVNQRRSRAGSKPISSTSRARGS